MYKSSIASVFSGIGCAEYALKKINVDFDIKFACDINECCKQTYLLNHNIDPNHWYPDIEKLNATKYKGQLDLLFGTPKIPVQNLCPFGTDDWNAFLHFAKIIRQTLPRTFVCCVNPGVLKHDNGDSLLRIKNIFYGLGYKCFSRILNAKNFGSPIFRENMYIIGSLEHEDFSFPTGGRSKPRVRDFLFEEVPPKYHLTELQKRMVRKRITKKQMNRAIAVEFEKSLSYNSIISSNDDIREISPLEMLRIKGFESDFELPANISKTNAKEQARSAIPVNLLARIFENIYI